MAKTSMNLEENVAGLLCYLAAWITGIIFIAMEKENKTVKFHAWQSFLTFLPLTILGWIFTGPLGISTTGTGYWGIPVYTFSPFYYVGLLIYALTVILWLILIITAYQGKKFKLPVVGDIAEKQAQK